MKINLLYIKVTLFLCLFCNVLFSQDKGTYIDNTMINVPNEGGAVSSESLNFVTPCGNFYVLNGKAWIKVDLGENYEFGNDNYGIPFDITMDLDIRILTDDPSSDPSISFNVQLNNNKSESIIYLDLNQYIDKNNNSTGFSYLSNKVIGVEGTIRNLTNTAPAINTATNLRVGLNYEINYGVDVTGNSVSNLRYNLIPDSKVIVFEWDDSCQAPGYEFQIIRLFNIDPETANNERVITTTIDWKKALSLYVEVANPSIDLTMGEGQGYYAWRVRPVGTFYENGIGNDRNWGEWNVPDFGDCTECIIHSSTGSNQVFFFTDPDDDKNFQYSRVFTENNKVSEQVTYATSLNQVIQTQRYIPSKNYKVITQAILDFSGRPTLNTLPVPISGERINQYKEGFATASGGGIYNAEHFDRNDNYLDPRMIDATGAFEYYSSANADKRIPDAEGYPFTRVIFSNDGTDRVVEQSGVGKTHMIGNKAGSYTRTTRTLYSTPTEDELVKLFGDEAPNHQDVAKIITIDPNNTRSVSYITKEGNTIATGLTFSEDSDVLDSVKDSNPDNTVSGVMDRITNNVKTTDGFMSSKRITVLQDNTEINVSYSITRQILDGLCNNLTFDLDYSLKIEIFDIETGEVIQSFEEPTLKDLTDNTDDGIDNVSVDFGDVILNTGTYYVQKTLIPSDNIKLEVINAEETLNKLIKPFFDWIINFSNRIDCEEEMGYLYNDIFHFGQLVFNKQITSKVNFDCDNCSNESINFLNKNPNDQEADDEFMDYYVGRESQYNITIFYFDDNGELQPIDYSTTSSLGGIKPVKVNFSTPCCDFSVPIIFTPPFKTPTPEALLAYKEGYREDDPQVSLPTQVMESISYYNINTDSLTTKNPDNWIHPNADFLFDNSENFTYNQNDDKTVELVNTEAYPIDFEGYAISMLYECKSSGDADYSREEAAQEIYGYMRGWHRPGLLNQMVYHMVTDDNGSQVCPRDGGSTTQNRNTNSLYEVCDFPKEKVFLPGASYSAQELAECWEPIVVEIVNRLCVSAYELNEDGNGNVADSYDERGGEGSTNEHLGDNINNFIIRWISKPKLIRKMKSKNVNGSGSALDQATAEIDNIVNTFLNCTGYSFGDIINKKQDENGIIEKPEANFEDFLGDFSVRTHSKTNEEYTLYDRNRLIHPDIADPNGNMDWGYFSLDKPLDKSNEGYLPPMGGEEFIPENQLEGRLAEFFPFIKDPVFAFKYYEYEDGAFPILEGETCYRDPNMCIDVNTGEEFACCGEDAEGNPIPCNFCEVGYITCEETKDEWDCEQRFTFYRLLKSYREEVIPGLVPINCENYYEATSYVVNPDYDKDPENSILEFNDPTIPKGSISSLEYLSVNLFVDYDAVGGYITNSLASMTPYTGFKDLTGVARDGVSIVEDQAREMIENCEDSCEQRADEFRDELIRMFEDRCYVIGDCKIDPNDNIVPEADINVLVEQMILQCKNQCEIDTFSCVDESCRLLGAPTRVDRTDPTSVEKFTLDISFTDFGVSGPVVYPFSERQNETGESSQKLKYFDPISGITTETDVAVSIESLGTSGLKKYSFNDSGYPFVTIWDIRQSLTYAQFTRWNQAMEWNVKLDLPSKCDITGNYNPDLTYDSQNLPNEPVYVNNGNGWIEQLFEMCADQSEYINRTNENGLSDTFVERDSYVSKTRSVYSSSGEDSGLLIDDNHYQNEDGLLKKIISVRNEGPNNIEEIRLFIDFELASEVKELRWTVNGIETALDPLRSVTSTSGLIVEYEYLIRDFSQTENYNKIFEIGETLKLIKVVSEELEEEEEIRYSYEISPVISPKVGINKSIAPNN
ncbi:hypothetical protein Q4566_16240 [Tamlana sp. 2_MG-2023]|uniref:hypothetical protein n=1 Tax=unclassified Tamlana TaxID=2614803 RepID=UPI0026E30B4A|nr:MULTISPECIES: hypothetical protein [unclassified Tamlana]MDO6761759.1 hypothetical protein [Tamlana sp. 2_MG-2023]MDO6792520.1 hypothetical protein [Tamlana sp. 1_MG-2023]